MTSTRDLPSAHAPLRDGPPIAEFNAFKDLDRDDEADDGVVQRVAARFGAVGHGLPSVIPLPIERWPLTTAAVLTTLHTHGFAIDAVRFERGDWPGQVGIVGLRRGVPSLLAAVVVDLTVEEDQAVVFAEIRVIPDGDDVATEGT